MKKSLLYIGNDLQQDANNPTYMAGLSVALRDEGYYVKTASSKSNKVLRLFDMCTTLFRLRKKVDFVLIDTYSTQNFYYAYVIGLLCRFYKLDYIPILHGGKLPKRLIHSPILCKHLFGKAHVNVSPSAYLLAAFHERNFLNTICIPNAIKLEDFTYKERVSVLPLKIFWMRSFKDIYNPLLALKVLEQLKTQFTDVQMTMAGPASDSTLEQCKKFAIQNKLPVTFLGKLSRAEWAQKATEHNLFLNTSRFDNMPLSLLEAMALGLPVVSTNVGGIPHFIENGREAILVDQELADPFCVAISRLATSLGMVKKLSQNGREKATDYDWPHIMEQWTMLLS